MKCKPWIRHFQPLKSSVKNFWFTLCSSWSKCPIVALKAALYLRHPFYRNAQEATSSATPPPHKTPYPVFSSSKSRCDLTVKCSVTLASVAAPPPGGRQGFGGGKIPASDTPHVWQCYTTPPKSQDKCYRGVRDWV